MKNKKDNKPYFDEREAFIKTIAEKEKRIAELEAKLQEANELNDNAVLNYADLKADLDVALEYINKPYPAPVAKPIVWEDFTDESDGSHELRAEIGANMRFRITSQCNDKVKQLLLIKYYNDYSVLDDHMFIGNFEEVEAAKQAAQDWLNKLVAECAVMGNTATQFTADEVEAIRKIAQFMGVTVADSIIAKCDTMLEGANE